MTENEKAYVAKLQAEIKRLRDGVREIYDDDLSCKRVRHNQDTAIQFAQATARQLLAAGVAKDSDEH